jgi:hypothetical protein
MRSLAARAFVALLFGVALARNAGAEGRFVGDATEAQKRETEKMLSEGKRLVKQGKFEQAIRRFREAHDIVKSPDATLMIAAVHRDTGDLLTARAEYRQALEEAKAAAEVDPKYRTMVDSIRKDLDGIDGVIGKLEVKLVHAPSGTTVTIDGEPIDTATLREAQLVMPGSITVLATAPDGSVSRKIVTVNAGQSTSVELAFVRERASATFFTDGEGRREDEGGRTSEHDTGSGNGSGHTLAWVAGGVGLAGLATFGVFGVLSKSKYDELEEACASNHCPPERRDDIENGKRFQTIANVGLGVGIAGAVTGAALFLFTTPSNTGAKKSGSLSVRTGFRSVEIRGSF